MLFICRWEVKVKGELISSPFTSFLIVILLGVGISIDRFDSYYMNVVLYRLIGVHVPH
jgi:hypothetical protein